MPKDKSKYTKEKEKPEKKVKSSGKGEKFADMSENAVIIDESAIEAGLKEKTKTVIKKEAKERGKKYKASRALVNKTKTYTPKEAFELLKKVSTSKFDGSVELHLNVADKGLSGEAKLPHFEGKALRVAIFDETVLADVKAGKIDFDVLLATPADMPKIMPLAKALGPKGLLPNPKNGTIVPDPKAALSKFSSTSLRYKTEKDFPLIHTVIGKVSQPTEDLIANFEALVKVVNPRNIKKAYIKSTMSPSIRVSLS